QAEPPRAALDRRRVQLLQHFRPRARRVLRHEHDRQALGHREAHRLLRHAQHAVQRPVLRVLADRRRANERARLDRDARLLRDARDRLHVRDHRAGRAVRPDRQLLARDLERQRTHVRDRARTRARQPDVRRVDAQRGHDVQQLDLLLDRRVLDRGRLQAVPQRLVVQLHQMPRGGNGCTIHPVPVVDQVLFLHPALAKVRPLARCRCHAFIVNRSRPAARRSRPRPARRRKPAARWNMTDLAAEIERIANHPALARARQLLRHTDDETLADQAELVAIPAPPFGEEARGRRMLERFREVGLLDAAVDDAGNVLARLPGDARDGAAPIILSAHLDTVFPEGTDLTVRRNGATLSAPGIADDARGLAAILAIARVLVRAGVRTGAPVVFAATVGEEGAGDLRGVKHLFREGSPWRGAAGFVSLDGTGCRRIVHRALGSRRLRATFTGPGGHSWADWGNANPVHALGLAIARLARL